MARINTPIILSLVLIVLLFIFIGSEKYISAMSTIITLLMLLLVMKERGIDLLSPINYLTYMIILNVFIRYTWIDVIIEDKESTVVDIFLLGENYEFLIYSSWIVLIGMLFFCIGYLLFRPKNILSNIFKSGPYKLNLKRAKNVVIAINISSSVALIWFIQLTAGFTSLDLSTISVYRGISEDIETYNAYGYLRMAVSLALISLYLSYAIMLNPSRYKTTFRINAIVSFLIIFFMGIFTQSRSGVVFAILNFAIIYYYLKGGKMPWAKLMVVVPITVTIFFIMTAVRGGSGYQDNDTLNLITAIKPIVLNNGGIDISKTGHIIEHVKNNHDYKYGATLLSLFSSAVPRSIWAEKPVNIDTYVGMNIYEATTYGTGAVPPGLISEMYMNFSWVGIVLGCLFLGIAVKQTSIFSRRAMTSVNWALIYVLVFLNFGVGMLGSGFSSTIMGMLMIGVPLLLVLKYIER